MAQMEAADPSRPQIVGLDPSLTMPGDSRAILREWGPKAGVVALLAAAMFVTYNMPAVKLGSGATLSLAEVTNKLTLLGKGWAFSLCWFAAVLGGVCALVFPESERFARTLAGIFFPLVAMVFPFVVRGDATLLDKDAVGIGSGLVTAWILFAAAALLPLLSLLVINRQHPLLGRDWGKWMFILPAIVWILMLTIFPLIYAFTTSRYAFRNGRINRFVGWDNYRRLWETPSWGDAVLRAFTYGAIAAAATVAVGLALSLISNREVTGGSLRTIGGFLPPIVVPVILISFLTDTLKQPLDHQLSITVFFVVAATSVEMVAGFLLALMMNRELRGRGALRAIMTLPLFAAPVGMGFLGRTIFYEKGGPVNSLLDGIGIGGKPWLSDAAWSRYTTVIVDIWQWVPFVFVIALAGLQGLPQDVLEASEVDGASRFQIFRYITMPLMAPILWLIVMLRTIDAFKVFDIAASMTLGGPGRETEYYSLYNYRTARKFFNYGDAAVQAFLLLLIVSVVVTLLWSKIKGIYEEEVIRA